MPDYLTTREVAELLRIKERKVYELVSDNVIPVSRVTGKLLFPRDVIAAWVSRHTEFGAGQEALKDHDPVVAGSHDPLLEWALRESGAGLAVLSDGSSDGLQRLAAGNAVAAGLHLPETDGGFNVGAVRRHLPGQPVVVMEWARRSQGLVLPRGNPKAIAGLADLAGSNLIPRQPGSGSRELLDRLLAAAAPAPAVTLVDPPARNEADVAHAVATGHADAGLAIAAVARQYGLEFLALTEERYDLAAWRRDVFDPPLQRLMAFCRRPAFAERAEELGGYDVSGLGTVHYNGP
ncbi:MAG: substrate-binding domain-containing protein [Hyphomicrobiales bacterium]